MSNPAMEALFGKAIGLDNYTIGAMFSHTMTITMLALIAVSTILLVIRNTRFEEETGMLELFRSLPTGKLAHTASALILLVSYNLLITVITTGILFLFNDDSLSSAGTILTGIIYGISGLFFGAVALLMAQLSNNSRSATVSSFGVLGVAYILRIIGDTSIEAFSLISPLGLLYQTKPYVENVWWPVFILLAVTLIIIMGALLLQHQRDVGSGILPSKQGKREASSLLKTLPGFLLSLLKTPLIAWTVALVLLGISYGSVLGEVESLISGNEIIEQIIASDPDQNIVHQFISTILGVLSIATAIPALQVIMKLYGEEKQGRATHLLIGKYSKRTVLVMFIIFSFLTSILMTLVQVAAFSSASISSEIESVSISDIFLSGLSYLPSLFVMIGISIFLLGWFPKWLKLTWGLLCYCFIILYFANLFDMPEWLKGISPYYRVPDILAGDANMVRPFILMILAILFSSAGLIGYSKREILG